MPEPILTVDNVSKIYASGHKALDGVSLTIERGEILALLGPNGAGKTTLISLICGIVVPTSGTVTVDGHDIAAQYRAARAMIGLVPQEIVLEPFETVIDSVRFSRRLFGKGRDPAHVERVLKVLSLWDKRESPVKELSGGMKRRVMIAKALAHEPRIIFLDEPSAGVDVELRKDMWAVVRALRDEGVTIILTTHYIEEAEEIADRVGVISEGRILLVEEKHALMRRLGRRQMTMHLAEPIAAVPAALPQAALELADDGQAIIYTYDDNGPAIGDLLGDIAASGAVVTDIETAQRSLEEIFVELVSTRNGKEVAR